MYKFLKEYFNPREIIKRRLIRLANYADKHNLLCAGQEFRLWAVAIIDEIE